MKNHEDIDGDELDEETALRVASGLHFVGSDRPALTLDVPKPGLSALNRQRQQGGAGRSNSAGEKRPTLLEAIRFKDQR